MVKTFTPEEPALRTEVQHFLTEQEPPRLTDKAEDHPLARFIALGAQAPVAEAA